MSPSGRVPQGVILIVSDTTRRDHLNFYGYGRETAPTLAKMASQGVRFTDNISQATWTKVSFPTIMTSLYSSTNRVKETNDQLPISAVTMAETFRGAGYATVGYSSVPFHGRLTGLHKGYEEFHERTSIRRPGPRPRGLTSTVSAIGSGVIERSPFTQSCTCSMPTRRMNRAVLTTACGRRSRIANSMTRISRSSRNSSRIPATRPASCRRSKN